LAEFLRLQEYVTPWTPRRVLDKLAALGFDTIAMTGIGQTVAWTCRKNSQ